MHARRQSRPWRPLTAVLAFVCLIVLAAVLAGRAGARDRSFQGALLGTFQKPTYVTQAPGESQLIFVVEQQGRVMLLRNGQQLTKPFLNIRSIVLAPGDTNAGGEEGLLSIAFPSNYQRSGRFYVYFTNNSQAIEVDEFHVSPTNPEAADRTTRRRVITIPHAGAQNHNGGQLQFGPDGFLYFATGDGGTNQLANARDLTSLLGKVIRIDPLPGGGQPYGIPQSNPYVGIPDRRPEIFAYGFRNPWRFSFDGRRIAIADVGQDAWEEVDMLSLGAVRGANFGWPKYEGNALDPLNPPGPDPPDPPTFPLFVYSHASGRCAIVGGYVVRDPSLPDLDGRYLYGDLCTGQVRSFVPHVATQKATDDARVGTLSAPGITSFGEGLAGQIYYAEGVGGGNVYQLEETP